MATTISRDRKIDKQINMSNEIPRPQGNILMITVVYHRVPTR
jgi:hypothetical protein